MTFQLTERLPRESARDYAMRFLLHHIVNLDLEPGVMISAGDMAEATGLSRTPIREAMQELEKTGIMHIYPQAGSQVSHIDYDKIEESRAIRLALETDVVMSTCGMELAADDVHFFEDIMEAQRNSLKRGDLKKLMEQDKLFHRQFYVIAGKMMTYQVMNDVRCHFDRLLRLSVDILKKTSTVEEHHDIFKAVLAGDREAAGKASTKHLNSFNLAEEKVIRASHPQYFADWPPR